jgi:hypothetical protein
VAAITRVIAGRRARDVQLTNRITRTADGHGDLAVTDQPSIPGRLTSGEGITTIDTAERIAIICNLCQPREAAEKWRLTEVLDKPWIIIITNFATQPYEFNFFPL